MSNLTRNFETEQNTQEEHTMKICKYRNGIKTGEGLTRSDAQGVVEAEDRQKVKHTPGPWKISRCQLKKTEHSAPDMLIEHGNKTEHSPLLCQVYAAGGEHPREANAKLIAAAPELLEALEKCADFMGSVAGTENVSNSFREALSEAKAAISKATA